MSGDEYNGWTNEETWNVALWIGNDEGLYHLARKYHNAGWKQLRQSLQDMGFGATYDGVSLSNPDLDIEQLDEFLKEL